MNADFSDYIELMSSAGLVSAGDGDDGHEDGWNGARLLRGSAVLFKWL